MCWQTGVHLAVRYRHRWGHWDETIPETNTAIGVSKWVCETPCSRQTDRQKNLSLVTTPANMLGFLDVTSHVTALTNTVRSDKEHEAKKWLKKWDNEIGKQIKKMLREWCDTEKHRKKDERMKETGKPWKNRHQNKKLRKNKFGEKKTRRKNPNQKGIKILKSERKRSNTGDI